MLKHKWAINISIAIATILLCFLSFEGFLRIYSPHLFNNYIQEGSFEEYDPILGWRLMPNAFANRHYYKGSSHPDGETISFSINSKGLRGDEYAYDKPLNTKRILLLGDSFTFGSEVDDNNTISQNMNYLLNKYNYQILNGGVPGYGTIQEYLFLSQEGMKYSPDIVMTLVFAYNDGADNIGLPQLGWRVARPVIQNGKIIPARDSQQIKAFSPINPWASLAYSVWNNSSVFRILGATYFNFTYDTSAETDYERQLQDTVFALREIDKTCNNANIKHIVVFVPDGISFNNDDSVAKLHKQYLLKFTGDIISNLIISNIDFIDLQPLLIKLKPLEDLYFINGVAPEHFTPKGNRIVAEILGLQR